MCDYRDLSGITKAAIACVFFYLAADLLFSALEFYEVKSLLAGAQPVTGMISPMFAFVFLAAYVICVIAVGRWTYLASASAHAISGEMTISPGWAVGSHFVPILNLFRPLQAMREIWLASHMRGNWHGEPMPPLLIGWWALWIIVNFIGNISWRLDESEYETAVSINLVGSLLNIPLCLLLILIMRRVARAQSGAGYDEVFA